MSHRQASAPAHGLGPAPRTVRIVLALALFPLVVATVVGLIALWPVEDTSAPAGFAGEVAQGTVVALQPCAADLPDCRTATVRLTDGPGAPGRVEARMPFGENAPTVRVGDKLYLGYTADASADQRYTFVDFDRGRPLAVLLALFVVGVLALSRWRGVGSLAGLLGSLLLIVHFTLPAILGGASALLVAMVTAATVMIGTLYLSHGVTVRTSIAMLGTLLALVVTGVLGSVFTTVARFTGMPDEGSQYVAAITQGVDLSGLLLAGLVIGALGVLDDVTVSQTAAVWELADADPTSSRRSLFVRGMRIGRDHAASTVNTLVLAYVGATLPMLLVFSALDVPFTVAVSREVVAQEVVRSLVGAIGLLSAIPLTTAVAALVAGGLVSRRRDLDTGPQGAAG